MRGTTLITLAVPEGVVMAADDLVYEYELETGKATPLERGARKVYAMGSILIGSSNTMRCSCSGRLVSKDEPQESIDVSIEYKFEDWIVDFIRERRGATDSSPKVFADALYQRMLDTFKPVEIMLEYGGWKDYKPGDRLVNYLVAGYASNYKNLQLLEIGAEYMEGRRLRYLGPLQHETNSAWSMKQPKDVYFGEDECFLKALDGIEPQSGVGQREASKCLATTANLFPRMPKALRELTANAVALVKVEAEFNPNKVGTTVNAAILDRVTKRHYLATF